MPERQALPQAGTGAVGPRRISPLSHVKVCGVCVCGKMQCLPPLPRRLRARHQEMAVLLTVLLLMVSDLWGRARARAGGPKGAEVECARGDELRRIGGINEALAAYQECILRGGGDAVTRHNVGVALIELGDYRAAKDFLSAAVALQVCCPAFPGRSRNIAGRPADWNLWTRTNDLPVSTHTDSCVAAAPPRRKLRRHWADTRGTTELSRRGRALNRILTLTPQALENCRDAIGYYRQAIAIGEAHGQPVDAIRRLLLGALGRCPHALADSARSLPHGVRVQGDALAQAMPRDRGGSDWEVWLELGSAALRAQVLASFAPY